MRLVWVLQHDDAEPAALIRTALERLELSVLTFRPDRKPLPDALGDDCSALVVMGGPFGAYEQEAHPWIVQELALLREALETGRPVLGICLGAQLLAAAGGANVYAADPPKEIGWQRIKLTADGQKDPLAKFLANPVTGEPTSVFQWHGDTFDLPPGAVPLATATRFPQQAFRLGRTAYGFQFHFEVTEDLIRRWVALWRRDLQDHETTADDILSGLKYHLPLLNRRGEELVRAFGALIHASPARATPGAADAAAAVAAAKLKARQPRIGVNPTGLDASNPAVTAITHAKEEAKRIQDEALRSQSDRSGSMRQSEEERLEELRRYKDYDPASRELDERAATRARSHSMQAPSHKRPGTPPRAGEI
jgi:GMP synthase (glutamine-hydrolysing)